MAVADSAPSAGPPASLPPKRTSGAGTAMLAELAREFAHLGPPIIVFNKSHSGSRLLAQLLSDLGVFMGADLNESNDALPILDLVHFITERHIPDFAGLYQNGDPDLPQAVRSSMAAHLQGFQPPGRWGWKLCETTYIVPVLAQIFPDAKFVHLVRDGRDVAFCDHVAPKAAFWRKVYFHTDRIERWIGFPMTNRAYRANAHIFNARHWVMSVSLGRAYGAMLGDRYIEVRYEDLISDLKGTARALCDRLELAYDDARVTALSKSVYSNRVSKWSREPKWKVREALSILEPALSELGYSQKGESGPLPRRSRLKLLLWSAFRKRR